MNYFKTIEVEIFTDQEFEANSVVAECNDYRQREVYQRVHSERFQEELKRDYIFGYFLSDETRLHRWIRKDNLIPCTSK